MAGSKDTDRMNSSPKGISPQSIIRLLVIPLLTYIVWLIEIYLLDGRSSLFVTLDPVMLISYTLVCCILIGTIVPVFLIRKSFVTGAVNMLQIGFRPLRRTVAICTVTVIACMVVIIFCSPPGTSRLELLELCLLYLPTAIASVMICWVLVGTHLQALVRSGGILVAVPAGVVFTSILFGLTTVVRTPAPGLPSPLALMILLGMVTALFFFAARDVYATVIVLTTGMVLLFSGRTDAAVLSGALPLVTLSALAALAALLGIHLYFSRRYTTVIVVPDS